MPGSHSTAIYDAISREGSIRTTLIRNEQAGAFAADGYARVTGEPGVVCTTAGPGATNALTGVAECWADSVPALLLAGQGNSEARSIVSVGIITKSTCEAMFRPVTQWCGTAGGRDDIPRVLGRAFPAMTWGRPRPAAVFLPQDVMRESCSSSIEMPAFPHRPEPSVPAEAIARAAEILARSGAARSSWPAAGLSGRSAAGEIEALAREASAPVVTTLNGKALLDERHLLLTGTHLRSARGRHVVPHADTMLAVGCRFTEVMTDWRRMPVPNSLIQIDLDPEQIGMNHPVSVGIVADARTAVGASG